MVHLFYNLDNSNFCNRQKTLDMKTSINLILLVLLLSACDLGGSTYGKEYSAQVASLETIKNPVDSISDNIQEEIQSAFVKSLMDKSDLPIIDLKNKLKEINDQNAQNIIRYWMAYLNYYHSIYFLQVQDKESSEKIIADGIEILENMENKNSEDYALLCLMKSFSIQFEKGMKIPFIASEVKEYGELAIKLDSANLRAYYVNGSNDFYTPEKYGGQTETEKYLKKAISLPDQKIKNKYLPSWGKEEAYEMLIKFYIAKERWEQAKEYYLKANEIYPENYMINNLATKLVGK